MAFGPRKLHPIAPTCDADRLVPFRAARVCGPPRFPYVQKRFLLIPLKDWGVWAVSIYSNAIRSISNRPGSPKNTRCATHRPAGRAGLSQFLFWEKNPVSGQYRGQNSHKQQINQKT